MAQINNHSAVSFRIPLISGPSALTRFSNPRQKQNWLFSRKRSLPQKPRAVRRKMQRRSRHVLSPLLRLLFPQIPARTAIVTAACLLAAFGAAQGQGAGKLRVLSDGELDRLTAGSAAGANAAATAQAIGSAPESGAAVSTVADAGGSPIAAAPFANYAATQILSYGSNAVSAQATGASRVFVDGGSGGARSRPPPVRAGPPAPRPTCSGTR